MMNERGLPLLNVRFAHVYKQKSTPEQRSGFLLI